MSEDQQRGVRYALPTSPDTAGAVLHRCGGCGQREWVMPDSEAPTVSQLLHRTVVARLTEERDAALDRCKQKGEVLQQSVGKDTWKHEVCTHDPETGPSGDFGRVSCEVIDTGYADHLVLLDPEEELVSKRHYDAAQCEAEALRDRLADTERLWTEACEVARVHCPCDVGRSHIVQGIPRLAAKVDKWQREAEDLRERIEAAYRALEAVGEMVPRGPAGDTLAAKIEALVAILRTAHAQKAVARTEGIASGRAAVIVEAVDLLNDRLKRMADTTARSTTVWAIELIKGIEP